MSGFKDLSVKLIFIAFAAILFLLGTTFFASETAPISRVIVMLVAAAILAVEVGLKKFTSLGKQRDVATMISGALIVSLALVALVGLTPWGIPSWLEGASNFLIIIAAPWVALEVFI